MKTLKWGLSPHFRYSWALCAEVVLRQDKFPSGWMSTLRNEKKKQNKVMSTLLSVCVFNTAQKASYSVTESLWLLSSDIGAHRSSSIRPWLRGRPLPLAKEKRNISVNRSNWLCQLCLLSGKTRHYTPRPLGLGQKKDWIIIIKIF